jgi:hypothetical protein
MPYTLDFAFNAGAAGYVDLRAQLYEGVAGSNVGAAISTGFSDLGSGYYNWRGAAIPSLHRGGVKFYRLSDPTTILAVWAINAQEGELIDAAVSSRIPAGIGGYAKVVPTLQSDTVTPIAGVDVWVTTDAAGVFISEGPIISDAFGNVTFHLDPGTYYLWRQLSGWNFSGQPEVLTVP